jgi:inhibitor of KinA sporulation pathway (predicted exonuclease)
MHSPKEQEAWESLENMDERQLKAEILDLRGEVQDLKAENENLKDEIKAVEYANDELRRGLNER